MKIVLPSTVSEHTQNWNHYSEFDVQTSIVSQVMWFWDLGVRLCWDGGLVAPKAGSDVSLAAMPYV